MINTLDHVGLRQVVEIVSVDNSPISSKLTEMGLVAGQLITTLFKAPFGDPIAIELNGTVLSLRLEEAQFIEVKA
jgi:Fe2+ transport system protein FeoA